MFTISSIMYNNLIISLSLSSRIIMESDASAIVNRVSFRADDIPLGEQTVAQVLNDLLNKDLTPDGRVTPRDFLLKMSQAFK